MRKTELIIFLLIIGITKSWATPKQFEVWFLSKDQIAQIRPLLQESATSGQLLAQALQCQPMGDYCFDPQVGLYRAGEQKEVKEEIMYEALDETKKYKNPGSATSLDRQLVNCEGEQAFDIFCGKSTSGKKGPEPKLELWIDISGTMKQVDFLGHDQSCHRESFVRALDGACPFNQKMKIHIYNESKKEAGNMNDVCLNYGLNEMSRLMRAIEESKTSYLIIITDIFEADERFISYIESTGVGTVRGLETPLYAKDMKKYVKELSKQCK